jgi:hypothetical protein
MQIGPFDHRDALRIEDVLNKHEVAYSVEVDEQGQEQILNEYHETAQKSNTGAAGSLDLRFIYIDFEDKDYPKIAKELERYGIVCDL